MKILLLCATMGNWGETNGIVTVMNNLIPHFKKTEHEVDIITYGPEDDKVQSENVTIITHKPRLPLQLDPNIIIDSTPLFSSTAFEARKKEYDIVNSWTPGPLGWLGVEISKTHQIPHISVYHSTLGDTSQLRAENGIQNISENLPMLESTADFIRLIWGNTAKAAMEQWMRMYYNQSDLILAPSEFTRDEASEKFRPSVEILSRGVDTEKFNPCFRDNGDSMAVYVGRIAPEKNMELLCKVFKHREIRIVGHGPTLEALRKELPRAIFTGRLDGKELAQAYANSGFFVFPSLTDTFGQVVQEAMASALPVIVMDKMGPKEMVKHSVNGFVASSEDEFEKYVDLLENNDDLREKMGKQAREYALTRTWDNVFDKLISYYNRFK